ncbi:MAG: DUF4397 domain-containing protein, partial [Woeseiaceae bacterium]|nr:DUF4397 domain-containing protein [Woeseiaceae bacterium]
MKHYLVAALLAATIIAGGCVSDSDLPNPTGEGTVRAINAIPTSPEISFLIEERFLAAAAFKNLSASSTWDDLDYTFNFNVLLAGDSETTRIASQFIDVIADTDYTMLVSGDLEAPDITVWESAIRDWNGDETFYELRFAHASPSLGPIDAYLLDPGVAPAAGTQSATLSFTEASPIQEVEAAEKVIILTPAGDDSTILFESLPLNLIATSSYIITTFDTDANDVGSIAVTLMNTSTNSTGRLVDVDDPATGRFFHASINAPDADVYLEDPLVT